MYASTVFSFCARFSFSLLAIFSSLAISAASFFFSYKFSANPLFTISLSFHAFLLWRSVVPCPTSLIHLSLFSHQRAKLSQLRNQAIEWTNSFSKFSSGSQYFVWRLLNMSHDLSLSKEHP